MDFSQTCVITSPMYSLPVILFSACKTHLNIFVKGYYTATQLPVCLCVIKTFESWYIYTKQKHLGRKKCKANPRGLQHGKIASKISEILKISRVVCNKIGNLQKITEIYCNY